MLTFYHAPMSCSTASHIALEESGITYDSVRIKLYKLNDHERYKREVNTRGTVPALQTEEGLLTENLAIMNYVSQLVPEKRLLPESSWERAQCLSFMCWLGSSVQIARRQFRKPVRFAEDDSTHAALARSGAARFREYVAEINKRITSGGPWVMGNNYSVADGYALVIYHWAVLDELDMTEFPGFVAYKERLLQRPAVRMVLERERCILLQS